MVPGVPLPNNEPAAAGSDRQRPQRRTLRLPEITTTTKGKTMNETFRILIENSTDRFDKIAALWDICTNYQYPTPATLFLDLIGYSLEEHGELLITDMTEIINKLGYLELSLLGEALDQFATRPHDAIQYVELLLDAERIDA
jgi:hypothetical protein